MTRSRSFSSLSIEPVKVSGFTSSGIGALTTAAIGILNTADIQILTTTQVSGLTVGDISEIVDKVHEESKNSEILMSFV